jgi:hypothetical protein
MKLATLDHRSGNISPPGKARICVSLGGNRPCPRIYWNRKRALRCSELAERATNPQVRAVLTYLAEHWLTMAVDLEPAQAWPEGLKLSAKN